MIYLKIMIRTGRVKYMGNILQNDVERTRVGAIELGTAHKRRAKTNELESGRVDKNARNIMI